MQGIYAIVNSINECRYIGSAVDIARRWSWHVSRLRNGKHDNTHFQRAWNKYGEAVFRFTVLEIVEDDTQLLIREEEIIAACPKNKRYNICEEAGRGPNMRGWKHTEQARANMAAAQRGRKHTEEELRLMRAAWRPRHTAESLARASAKLRGRKLTPEHRAKVVAALDRSRGRKHSLETRRKLSEQRIGLKASAEARAKMSAARKGKPKSDAHRAAISAGRRRAYSDLRTGQLF